ncbi:uncharacterized protein [Hyperolius riggenbachi]|uniref:uncharacterized protein n=1 Tax=Hyperolius riggenbachi TaxID=752182 RepID=UPI0035A32308
MTSAGEPSKAGRRRAERMEPLPQQDNKNTLKKTRFDLRIVQGYLVQRAREERPLLAIPVEELDAHLANFIRTHRKQDGSEYEAGTLRGILGSLDRHFERAGYPHAIYRSRQTKFLRTVAAMKEKQSFLKAMGRGGPPGQAEPLTQREIELLYATGAIGLHNPTALLYMLFFNMGLHFSLRTMEQHHLKWGDITLKADAQGRKYLEHTKRPAPGGRGNKCPPSHAVRMQIYESPEQPERDVVKAYEKYSVERPEKMKCEDAPFYLTPQPDCRPGYARWFKNLPMGEARIRGIMKHLKMAAGLIPQRKGANRIPPRGPVMMMGSSMASILSAQVKASLNGCRSNGLAIKREVEDPYGVDTSSDTERGYHGSGIGGLVTGEPLSGGIRILPSGLADTPKLKSIKEEWEQEEPSNQEGGGRSSFLGHVRGSVTFHDVAACFSAVEWNGLEDWQKELYKNVMREIHSALEAMGYKIVNTDLLLKVKEEEECDEKNAAHEKSAAAASGRSFSPDILLRIKRDEEMEWRDMEAPEKEDDLDTSSRIPVFDPDVGMWVFKDNPDMSLMEDGGERTSATDTDEGTSSMDSTPATCKQTLPEISTLRRPICPELPRPGKRKRRPPQRRTSEQVPDSDDDEGEPNHRLPCRNPPVVETEDKKDWMAPEKTYQCDLCERTFNDHQSLQDAFLTCPQCSGTLNPILQQPANDQTLNATLPRVDSGTPQPTPQPTEGPSG